MLSILPWARKARDSLEGRRFPPSSGILKKDLFSSHCSAPLLFPRVSQLQFLLCRQASQALGRAGHLGGKRAPKHWPEDPRSRTGYHRARAPRESPPKGASFKELQLLLFFLPLHPPPPPLLLSALVFLGNPLLPAERFVGSWGPWVCTGRSGSWRNKSSGACGGCRGRDLNGR